MTLSGQELLDHLYYKKLPKIYLREDSRQDNKPLYRYLQSLILGGYATALQESEDLMKLIDPATCPAEFFPHFYRSWGLQYFEDIPISYHRKMLSNVGTIYKRRGTYSCLKYLVRLLSGQDVVFTMTHNPVDGQSGKLLTITLVADTMKAVNELENSLAVVTRFLQDFIPYNLDITMNSNIRVQSMTTARYRSNLITQSYSYNLV